MHTHTHTSHQQAAAAAQRHFVAHYVPSHSEQFAIKWYKLICPQSLPFRIQHQDTIVLPHVLGLLRFCSCLGCHRLAV
jgi:hypothetical protein